MVSLQFWIADGTEAEGAANGRVVPPTAGGTDQRESPAGQVGRIDRLERIRAGMGATFPIGSRTARNTAPIGGWAAVPATHLCLLG